MPFQKNRTRTQLVHGKNVTPFQISNPSIISKEQQAPALFSISEYCNLFLKLSNTSRNYNLHLCHVILMSPIKSNKMNLKKTVSFAALASIILMGSCKKDEQNNLPAGTPPVENSTVSHARNVSLTSVNLGVAGNFAILSETGITDVYQSFITGDIGSSPITGAAVLVSCAEVVGNVYTVDAAGPACKITSPSMLTSAISDMQTAYTDAAGRSNPDFLNLGAGNIGGFTLIPGLYKWTTALLIPASITINGGPNDIFIFQIDGTLIMSSAVNITLTGGARPENIFWQVAGAVTLGTTSHFEGIILGQTGINLQTGASINGRTLAQTAVTLQMNTVTQP